MGWNNPPVPWAEFERKLSGGTRAPKAAPAAPDAAQLQRSMPAPDAGRGPRHGGCPTPSCTRTPTSASSTAPPPPRNCCAKSARLGLHGLAITDHDGLYGIVRMAEAAEQFDIATVFGAELSLGLGAPQNGVPDPEGSHLVVLARGEDGYHRLAAALTAAQLAGGEKGRPVYDLDRAGRTRGGPVERADRMPQGQRCGRRSAAEQGTADATDRERAAEREVRRLVDLFGARPGARRADRPGIPARLRPQRRPGRHRRSACPCRPSPPATCTTPTPRQHALAGALAAVRARRSLDEHGRLAAGIRRRAPAEAERRWPPGSPATPARSSARWRWPTTSASSCAPPGPACRSRRCRPGTPR